jgi:ketosteroid isomerase-like protein
MTRPGFGGVALGLGLLFPVTCSPTDSPALRSAVESATTAFHQALQTNDSARVLAYVADDVLMMPPGEPPVRGKEAMRAWYAAFLSQYQTSDLVLSNREVILGAGWATELGAYEWHLTPVTGGAPMVDHGHYMQVWTRLPSGEWRFAREIWNSSVILPAPSGP